MALGENIGALILISGFMTGGALQSWDSTPAITPDVGEVAYVVSAASSASAVSAVANPPSPNVVSDDADYQFSQKDINALILNAFNEARGESAAGIRAVLGVTMARVDSACYPDSVHDVVYQRKQFSWTWQRGTARTLTAAKAREPASYQRVKSVVTEYIADGAKPSQAMLYHTRSVNPSWAKAASVERIKTTGSHIFYENKRC